MDFETTLIRIYLFVTDRFAGRLYALAQRQSNHSEPAFTDAEVLTIYLFGAIRGRRTVADIHTYAADHFADWFPLLPGYAGFVHRLNRLDAVFPAFCEAVLSELLPEEVLSSESSSGESSSGESPMPKLKRHLVDSFPIAMAEPARSATARVAPTLADKGYSPGKRQYFYGVKLHVLAFSRPGRLPVPDRVGPQPGSANDLTVCRQVLPALTSGGSGGREIFADKAYANRTLRRRLLKTQNLELVTQIKRVKGQPRLSAADRLYSEAVSRIRQPIEALFGWIQEKTGIQTASKVRSEQGLMVHVFGRLAAAMLLLAFDS
jgi:hypothetical protein